MTIDMKMCKEDFVWFGDCILKSCEIRDGGVGFNGIDLGLRKIIRPRNFSDPGT